MIFWILMALWALTFILVASAFAAAIFSKDDEEQPTLIFGGVFVFIIAGLMFGVPTTFVWTGHANDISIIRAQEPVIQVQRDRIERLSGRLDAFQYPDGSALLNADSPVAAIVKSLSDAEDALAKAESERALALRSIEARKAGPMSGVVTIIGEK